MAEGGQSVVRQLTQRAWARVRVMAVGIQTEVVHAKSTTRCVADRPLLPAAVFRGVELATDLTDQYGTRGGQETKMLLPSTAKLVIDGRTFIVL